MLNECSYRSEHTMKNHTESRKLNNLLLKLVVLTSFCIFSLMILSGYAKADVMITSLGSAGSDANNNAIGAYYWDCYNFSSNTTAYLTTAQVNITTVSGLSGTTVTIGVYNGNTTRGVNATSQLNGNSSGISSFSLGKLNFTWAVNNPYLYANTSYWLCFYAPSNNYIRLGETVGASGQGIYAHGGASNGHLEALTLDANGGSNIVKTIAIQLYGSVPTNATISNFSDNSNTLINNGTAVINATVINTNGTVYLQFNGFNYTATNLSSSSFTVNISLAQAGLYIYKWYAYGTGVNATLAFSNTFSYYVLASATRGIFYMDLTSTSQVFLFIFFIFLSLIVFGYFHHLLGSLMLIVCGMIPLTSGYLLMGMFIIIVGVIGAFSTSKVDEHNRN